MLSNKKINIDVVDLFRKLPYEMYGEIFSFADVSLLECFYNLPKRVDCKKGNEIYDSCNETVEVINLVDKELRKRFKTSIRFYLSRTIPYEAGDTDLYITMGTKLFCLDAETAALKCLDGAPKKIKQIDTYDDNYGLECTSFILTEDGKLFERNNDQFINCNLSKKIQSMGCHCNNIYIYVRAEKAKMFYLYFGGVDDYKIGEMKEVSGVPENIQEIFVGYRNIGVITKDKELLLGGEIDFQTPRSHNCILKKQTIPHVNTVDQVYCGYNTIIVSANGGEKLFGRITETGDYYLCHCPNTIDDEAFDDLEAIFDQCEFMGKFGEIKIPSSVKITKIIWPYIFTKDKRCFRYGDDDCNFISEGYKCLGSSKVSEKQQATSKHKFNEIKELRGYDVSQVGLFKQRLTVVTGDFKNKKMPQIFFLDKSERDSTSLKSDKNNSNIETICNGGLHRIKIDYEGHYQKYLKSLKKSL